MKMGEIVAKNKREDIEEVHEHAWKSEWKGENNRTEKKTADVWWNEANNWLFK